MTILFGSCRVMLTVSIYGRSEKIMLAALKRSTKKRFAPRSTPEARMISSSVYSEALMTSIFETRNAKLITRITTKKSKTRTIGPCHGLRRFTLLC